MPRRKKLTSPLDDAMAIAATLSKEDLAKLKQFVEQLSEAIEEDEQSKDEPETAAKGKRGGGYLERKYINQCGPYLYFRYSDGTRLRSLYRGKAAK